MNIPFKMSTIYTVNIYRHFTLLNQIVQIEIMYRVVGDFVYCTHNKRSKVVLMFRWTSTLQQ